MIYLRDNPLLREPLQIAHIKHRLLGHWGASPGLSFAYVHLNRLILKYDLDAIFLAGPGHGAPGVLARASSSSSEAAAATTLDALAIAISSSLARMSSCFCSSP